MSEKTETAVDGDTELGVASGGSPASVDDLSGVGTADRQDGASTASDPPASRGLPLDETFELLRNQRRRRVLRYLAQADGEVSLSELAEQIAAWENDKEVRQITSSERKRVYVGLYQCHLPKMDGMDVISFNKPRGLIERGENADAVEPYLRRPESTDSSRTGFAVGPAVVVLTAVPVAILLQSQAALSVTAAVAVVAAATLAGVGYLLRDDAEDDEGTGDAVAP